MHQGDCSGTMTNDTLRRASEVLGDQAVLRGAWMRVDSWYRLGELAPQPELSRWRLHPEAMLRDLGRDLREGNWSPQCWFQIPYPKKGARLRHYLMPTVRDQVAFMVHMVALGPILDQQIANFAFGNRWYRPIYWNHRGSSPRWELRPYPLLTNQTYLSYARSYGLFRRVANWTVARMTNAKIATESPSNRVQHPEDYADGLPKWVNEDWWQGGNKKYRSYWAALDIELAYPSIQINKLADAMRMALQYQVNFSNLFDGYPDNVSVALQDEMVRLEVGERLVGALANVRVDTCGIPSSFWTPPDNHRLPKISVDPYEGIPTGLAISGMLLNVALIEADLIVEHYLESTSGYEPAAILRFADDMYVLSRSSEGLFSLIEAVHGALSGNINSYFNVPNDSSNICINLRKIKPLAVQDVIYKYLDEHDWVRCCQCKQPLPGVQINNSGLALTKWWKVKENSNDTNSDREPIERTSIGEGDVGPFVTSLVERLSDMGTDTLRQRFGNGARDYLAQLHDLARFDIEDELVRPDTRRTFSVNRLVRAWLPRNRESGEEQVELQKIRQTISLVLNQTPWKFVLWRTAVRGAARRPLTASESEQQVKTESLDWLSKLLIRISSGNGSHDSISWLNQWPENIDAIDNHKCEQADYLKKLYLSFLRTSFWHSLAEVVRELKLHEARFTDDKADSWIQSPDRWSNRAIPEKCHGKVAEELGKIERWVEVLYPQLECVNIDEWPWEIDEFVGAVLSIHSTVELTWAWQRTDGSELLLKVPNTKRLQSMPKVSAILSKCNRLKLTWRRPTRKIDYWGLSNIQMGHWDKKLGKTLFPTPDRFLIRRATDNPQGVIAAGFALGCFGSIGSNLAYRVIPSSDTTAYRFDDNPLLLQDYVRARQMVVVPNVKFEQLPTVHRLLWGMPSCKRLADWEMAVWETPAEGFPSRVAVAIFNSVYQNLYPPNWEPRHGPLTWLIDDDQGVLASGRRSQFLVDKNLEPKANTPVVKRSAFWEVIPNAAFFLPIVSAARGEIHAESYLLYCDVLILLTMLDGSERILDVLVKRGISGTPFSDKWAWRSRIHLPLDAWEIIEKILRWCEHPKKNMEHLRIKLLESFSDWSHLGITTEDFLPERIDIGLSLGKDSEIVRTISLEGELVNSDLPPELRIADTSIDSDMVVRVGQVTAWPNSPDVVKKFPQLSVKNSNEMIEQVSNVFLAPAQSIDETQPQLVILPELAIPPNEVNSLRNLVRTEEKAVVAGLYWRELKPAFQRPNSVKSRFRYIINEAEFITPIGANRGPRGVRWFRVRKPVLAHLEHGLARALSKKIPGTKWRMLPGRRWYRFVHPKWGDFTVAICADLIDSAPWRALRGDLLHLFMVAFNKDVNLFDSLTWVRAYENYVNVASVNHGKYGGSFLWTPRREHERELARLRGSDLLLIADVSLPIRGLLEQQITGCSKAEKKATKYWQKNNRYSNTEFKAPPPGFQRNGDTLLPETGRWHSLISRLIPPNSGGYN